MSKLNFMNHRKVYYGDDSIRIIETNNKKNKNQRVVYSQMQSGTKAYVNAVSISLSMYPLHDRICFTMSLNAFHLIYAYL